MKGFVFYEKKFAGNVISGRDLIPIEK